MLLGIVSDTHGHLEFARQAVRMLESCGVDCLLHCGDIGSPDIVSLFSPWPAHFVFGNVDTDAAELRRAIEHAGQHCHGRFGELELAGRSIAFLHGDDSQRMRDAIAAQSYDLVCYGHTHVAEQHRQGRTLVLNPGALYRAQPHTLAVVRLKELEAAHLPL